MHIVFLYIVVFKFETTRKQNKMGKKMFAGDFIRNLVALESGGSGGVVWRIRSSDTKLVCAVGSRNGTEETKLLVLDFDVVEAK